MKFANIIVIGGPISVGKSTLASSLGMPQIPELNENDKIQMVLLEDTYHKGLRISQEIIEVFFLNNRIEKYKLYANTPHTHILDRSILESLWFAKENLGKKSFEYFKKLWTSEVKDLFQKYGKPKKYFLLTMDWETFENRFFKRGRNIEVENFQKNKTFFKKHIKEYENYMKDIFAEFEIPYIILKTDDKTPEEIKMDVLSRIGDIDVN